LSSRGPKVELETSASARDTLDPVSVRPEGSRVRQLLDQILSQSTTGEELYGMVFQLTHLLDRSIPTENFFICNLVDGDLDPI
jgi:hypothetical protein